MASPFPDAVNIRLSPRVSTWIDARDKPSYSLRPGDSSYSETVYIIDDSGSLQLFIEDVLGWAVKDGLNINRKLPAQHPDFGWLWCSGISSVEPVGAPDITSGLQGGARGRCNLLKLKLAFSTPPYPMKETVNVEYQRFVAVQGYETSSQFIQRKNGQFVFNANTPAPMTGQAVPDVGGQTIKVSKTRIKLLWVNVPDNGFFTNGWPGAPTKVLNALGKVNDASFLGKPADTVLFESFNPIPRTQPVSPTLLGLGADQVPRSWDVELVFTYFQPAPEGATEQGWNLVPNPVDNKWYRIYVSGQSDADGYWMYKRANFDTIFQMN